ncbi:hypothetical protein ACJ8IO_13445 [Serratia sp. CY44083]
MFWKNLLDGVETISTFSLKRSLEPAALKRK